MITKQHTLGSRNLIIDRFAKSIVLSSGITNRKNPKVDKRSIQEKTLDSANEIKQKAKTKELNAAYLLNDISTDEKKSSYLKKSSEEEEKPKKTHKRKSFRTIKKLNQLINLFYEKRNKKKQFYWVTLTTLQHQTGKSDKELFYAFKLWIQHRGVSYISVAERQRNTGDLHFHVIIQQETDFNIKKELKRLAGLLGTNEHPAQFDVKRIFSIKKLVTYISKYVRKSCPSLQYLEYQWSKQFEINPKTNKPFGFKPPYSSLFHCRTFSCSQDISNLFKTGLSSFRLSMPVTTVIEYYQYFVKKYQTQFFTVYEWNIDIWTLAQSFKQKVLKSLFDTPQNIPCLN